MKFRITIPAQEYEILVEDLPETLGTVLTKENEDFVLKQNLISGILRRIKYTAKEVIAHPAVPT